MSERSEPSTAVVIGGSMAGLLAARVLSGSFERVTIVERDRFPDGVENRKSVPQGHHAHALLPRGQMILERLFPGLSDELASRGAIAIDAPAESRWHQPGGYRVRFETGRKGLFMSRALLEGRVRERVRALPNVAFLPEHNVAGLLFDGDAERVSGVSVKRRAPGASVRRLSANLVVDASGRGSKASAWLESLGYERPEEERIEIGVGYTTLLYRRSPDDLPGSKFILIQSVPGRNRRSGALFPLEGERWMVTLTGWLGDRAPTDEDGFIEFAKNLPAPDIHEAIKDAEPLGDAVKYNFSANLRRRYERLGRVPEGSLVTGDALCSFNPVYGQGMTVSALEAVVLDESLDEGRDGLPKRFYERAAKVIDVPWQLAAGADLAYPGVEGERTRSGKVIGRYIGYVIRAATRDERVCLAFIKVTNLVAPPTALFHPAIVFLALRHALVRRGRVAAPSRPAIPASKAA